MPRKRIGLEYDEIGRTVARVDFRTALIIADGNTVTEKYLTRAFNIQQADRIMTGLTIIAYRWQGRPLPQWLIEAAREL
jgi:hypothetical protein